MFATSKKKPETPTPTNASPPPTSTGSTSAAQASGPASCGGETECEDVRNAETDERAQQGEALKEAGIFAVTYIVVNYAADGLGRVLGRFISLLHDAPKWVLGAGKSEAKWASQMEKRGWTQKQVSDAISRGKSYPAENLVNKGNPATRYVNPETGRSIVIDDVTREVIHVGGDGFKY
jgi:hypothetical protein